MTVYDAQIMRVRELLKGLPFRAFSYDAEKVWPENTEYEMVFQRDVAYELGGGRAVSANLTCVTEDPDLFREEQGAVMDQIRVYGPELQEIKGNVSYARFCEVLVRSDAAEDENQAADSQMLKLLQDIDFVKFHIYGKGFMMRTSGQSAREPVRVSRKALQDGISFERMGDTFLSHYKKNPKVIAARVSFITLDTFDYEGLFTEGGKAVEIRNSLSKIQKGLPTECSVCEIREICNEVEGLRELHFGRKTKEAPRVRV